MGSGDAVAVDGAEAVDVGRAEVVGVSLGLGVDSGDVKSAVAIGGGVAVPVGPRARGVRVGVGVGGGVRAGQPARTTKTTALIATARNARLRNRIRVFFRIGSLIP